MKKILFILLWMMTFFVFGFVVFGLFDTVIMPISPQADHSTPAVQHKELILGVISLVCVFGLPLVALILGIVGKLPGTQSRKDVDET